MRDIIRNYNNILAPVKSFGFQLQKEQLCRVQVCILYNVQLQNYACFSDFGGWDLDLG